MTGGERTSIRGVFASRPPARHRTPRAGKAQAGWRVHLRARFLRRVFQPPDLHPPAAAGHRARHDTHIAPVSDLPFAVPLAPAIEKYRAWAAHPDRAPSDLAHSICAPGRATAAARE